MQCLTVKQRLYFSSVDIVSIKKHNLVCEYITTSYLHIITNSIIVLKDIYTKCFVLNCKGYICIKADHHF